MEGTTTTPFDMLVRNGTSRYQLVIAAIRRLGDRLPEGATVAEACRRRLREHRTFIEQEGVDPPEITGWRWRRGAG